jgi:signal transduction histidine kinase/CheY-like chemotaxis protein
LGASQRIIRELPIAVYVANRWGEVLDANPALLDLLGVASIAELADRPLADFAVGSPDGFGWLPPEGDLTLRGAHGHQRAVFHTRILREEAETTGYSFGVLVDADTLRMPLTEESGADSTDRSSSGRASSDTMTGGVVHGVNNLLVTIIGQARLASNQAGAHSPAQAIEQAALRAAELTNQLVDSAEKPSSIVRELDLSELVRDMEHLLKGAVPETVRLDLALAEDLPRVDGNTSQLRQVVMHLITNAADALAGQPGSVRVGTGREQACAGEDGTVRPVVYVEVSDTGGGIDGSTKTQIFDPFFSTKQPPGRGLGLAVVAGIVRKHDGTIDVDGTASGTTVRISLPIRERGADVRADRLLRAAAREPSTGTVLVVDDDEGIRVVTRMMMEKAGFRVLAARDGAEAVEVFQKHEDAITAVLLDLKIPKIDSRDVFEFVQRIRPDTPVILSSGYPEAEARRRFGTSKFAAYVQKPYTQRLLLKQVQDVLEG